MKDIHKDKGKKLDWISSIPQEIKNALRIQAIHCVARKIAEKKCNQSTPAFQNATLNAAWACTRINTEYRTIVRAMFIDLQIPLKHAHV